MKRRKKTRGAVHQPSVQETATKGLPPAPIESSTLVEDASQALIQESIKRASISDTPATEDEIGFQPYVGAIAAFLIDERTRAPLTLSIEGEWGAGKSSFMSQLEQTLHSKYGKKTVKFNAWRHDKDEALWASFAIEFARQIVPRRRLTRLWKRLMLFKHRFSMREGLPSLLRLLAGIPLLVISSFLLLRWFFNQGQMPEWLRWFTDASLALKTTIFTLVGVLSSSALVKKIAEFAGNPFQLDLGKFAKSPDYQGRLPFLEQFHQDFRAVLDIYVGPEIDKVFVFIDDLDRCEVPKAAELIQALHLMIPDNTKLIFVLGMDRNIVAAGIAQRHADILPLLTVRASRAAPSNVNSPHAALAFGHAFLERFIQIPFRIPRMEGASLQAFCESLMLDPELLSEKKRDDEHEYLFDFDWSKFDFEKPQPQAVMMIEAADADSPAMREIVAMVAPALDFNPRRLKQFINAFRLNAFLYSELGHFDVMPEQETPTRLNLAKLSKLVALELWWPRLLDDAERDPTLIRSLEMKLRSSEVADAGKDSPWVYEWASQDAPMRILSIGLHAGIELGGLDIRKLRCVAPVVRRTGITTNWRRRNTAAWRPTTRFLPKLFLQFLARSQESEAKTNLMALYTSEKAYFGMCDRYETDFQKLGFQIAPRKDGTRPPVPDERWLAGDNFIYTVELQGSAFYGYALGIDGRVKDVEYEIRSDSDWKGRPRRISPAAVDSSTYRSLQVIHEGLYIRLKYPSTLEEMVHRLRGETPRESLTYSPIFTGAVPNQAAAVGTKGSPSKQSANIEGPPFESVLVSSDKGAHLRIRAYDGSEWERVREETNNPSHSGGKQVLTRTKGARFFSASGYVSGWAFTHTVVLKHKVVVELELRCEVQAKTGYAQIMQKIINSIETAHRRHWSVALFWRRA
jgi:hypothetical protein